MTAYAHHAFEHSIGLKAAPPAVQAELIAKAQRMVVNANQTLFAPDEQAAAVFCVLDGELEVSAAQPVGAKTRSLEMAAPGAMLGEIAVLSNTTYGRHAIAVRRSTLLQITQRAIHDVLTRTPEAAIAIMAAYAQQLATDKSIEDRQSCPSLEARLARLLVNESKKGIRVVPLTQSSIARRMGACRESVNRRLSQWRRAGIVEIGPAGVRLINPAALDLYTPP